MQHESIKLWKITKDETKKVDDTTPGEISGDGTDANPYKIQSIEDLVYFENQVNNGNNYTGKTIKLEVSLNFASVIVKPFEFLYSPILTKYDVLGFKDS